MRPGRFHSLAGGGGRGRRGDRGPAGGPLSDGLRLGTASALFTITTSLPSDSEIGLIAPGAAAAAAARAVTFKLTAAPRASVPVGGICGFRVHSS